MGVDGQGEGGRSGHGIGAGRAGCQEGTDGVGHGGEGLCAVSRQQGGLCEGGLWPQRRRDGRVAAHHPLLRRHRAHQRRGARGQDRRVAAGRGGGQEVLLRGQGEARRGGGGGGADCCQLGGHSGVAGGQREGGFQHRHPHRGHQEQRRGPAPRRLDGQPSLPERRGALERGEEARAGGGAGEGREQRAGDDAARRRDALGADPDGDGPAAQQARARQGLVRHRGRRKVHPPRDRGCD
mmetsp:Transcript_52054/g.129643  ORF Transcript_52054/g.129643 Transcript_52054/m.129643 type:complete len:238 (-) Transcript_52054:440-1153(-)